MAARIRVYPSGSIDWDYHRDNPGYLLRLWDFQPDHQTEWSKLLATLDDHLRRRGGAPAWLATTTQHLFDRAVERAWDKTRGGLWHGFAPDGTICDDDKYFWFCSVGGNCRWRIRRRRR